MVKSYGAAKWRCGKVTRCRCDGAELSLARNCYAPVQLGQDVQHKERKSEVSVDDGVAERERDVLKGTKGVLRGGQAVADPLGSVVVRVEERFDHWA